MSKKKITQTSLPLSRTTKIMNSAVGVESVDQDSVALATKATELFLVDFARRAYSNSDSNVLEYEDIQKLVHSDPRYDFLIDTTPKRIKYSEALRLIEESKRADEQFRPQQAAPTKLSATSPVKKVEPEPRQSFQPTSSEQQGSESESETASSLRDSNNEND